jgi:ABC-type polysaccharide/polyol phosphate transport system ATPase subunit
MAEVVLEDVCVDFPIYGAQRDLRRVIAERAAGGLIQREGTKHERVVIKALVDASLTLRDGDRVGLIGHNGSGKSTLLKVIAGIYEPIRGRVLVDGRITPLFDMMPGLDPEDTGYENVITAGMLLGLSRKEIERRISQPAGADLFHRHDHPPGILRRHRDRSGRPADGRGHSRRRCPLPGAGGAAAERIRRP